MNTATGITLVGALAAIWLTAGLLADALPTARTARELRRRTGLLSLLVGAGALVFVAVPVTAGLLANVSATPAALLPVVPAMVVLTATLRRLVQIHRGAGAFATAPLAPLPPGLRAAAAHPLVSVPLQVTGLAALAGLPIAAGLIRVPGAGLVGIALTVAAVVIVAIGVRAALRHSRLSLVVTVVLQRTPAELAGLASLGGQSPVGPGDRR